jgi:hypothetical protein
LSIHEEPRDNEYMFELDDAFEFISMLLVGYATAIEQVPVVPFGWRKTWEHFETSVAAVKSKAEEAELFWCRESDR